LRLAFIIISDALAFHLSTSIFLVPYLYPLNFLFVGNAEQYDDMTLVVVRCLDDKT